MAQTAAPRDVAPEYRAVVECLDDPCSYCRSAKSRHADKKTYDTAEDALDSGQRLASLVYGASVHRVEVEGREATPWAVVDMANRRH